MRISTTRRAAGVMAALLLAATAFPLSAAAASFSVTLEKQIIFGEPGERFPLGTFDMPAELIGMDCTVAAEGNNNESVHPGNNIEVTSVNTVVLVGVEDSPNKTTTAAGLLTVGEQTSFTLVLGDDPVYSAEFLVSFECQPEETTTTTTVPETTTTTVPETTTTVPETTTTTTPTPTTVPETTTTLPPQVSSTTLATTTTSVTPDTLPFTGSGSDEMALMALLALAAGSGLVLLSRHSAEES
jgi:hypothetical protein